MSSDISEKDSNDRPAAPSLPPIDGVTADATTRPVDGLHLAAKPVTGDQLGRFVLQEKLGQGAMGTVFAAVQDDSKQRVAIKLLDSSFTQKPEGLRRFRKEGLLLAETTSPYITRLLEINDKPPHPFIAVELVDGPSLGELLKTRTALHEKQALHLAAQVAEALKDIAHLNIIHRDIKPDNILLARNHASDASNDPALEFTAKLTDFGLARHTDQSQSMELTRDNAVLGTPLFMSPEQFVDATKIDARSDIYSLGATLFHMLVGHPPFKGNDIARLAEMHRHTPAPDLRTSLPGASDAISEVIRKCLQKRADLRYQTAAELLGDLHKVINGEAISITIHPLIPDCDRGKVMNFRNEWNLNSTPEQLWPFVSNTERLNRAIGLPAVRYTNQVIDDKVETHAHVRIAGMNMKWQEHAFEWIEARRMGILREFEKGPIKWFTSVVEFVPTVEGETKLIHRFQVEPRNWFGKAFAKLKFGLETPRSLQKVYSRIDAVLASTKGLDPLVDAFETTKNLSAARKARFADIVTELQNLSVDRNALLQLTEFAQLTPAQEAGRIRPLHIADRLQLPFANVMEVLLRGTISGLFELKWDVICPSCRLASQTFDLLQLVSDHEHCAACNLKFEVDLRNQVEVIFAVHPQLRSVDTGKYCIGGPAHSPHVVAQTRIMPDENVQLGLALQGGSYVVRGPQLPQPLHFSVADDDITDDNFLLEESNPEVDRTAISSPQDSMQTKELQRRHWAIKLAATTNWKRLNARLGFGQQLIELHNGFDHELTVRIERASPRTDAMTAAAILGLPLFRELFPSQTFGKSQLAAISVISLMQTRSPSMTDLRELIGESADSRYHEHLRRLAELCAEYHGTWIKITDCGALMSFVNQQDAIDCAGRVASTVSDFNGQAAWKVACAVTTGQTQITSIAGQLDYLGMPVEHLQQQLLATALGDVRLPDN